MAVCFMFFASIESYVMHIFIHLKWAWIAFVLMIRDHSSKLWWLIFAGEWHQKVFLLSPKIDHSEFKIGSCCQTLMDREFSFTRTYTRQQEIKSFICVFKAVGSSLQFKILWGGRQNTWAFPAMTNQNVKKIYLNQAFIQTHKNKKN